MLVHNAKLKIQEEYTRKEKEREINKRMYNYVYIATSCDELNIARYMCLVPDQPRLVHPAERR